MKGESFADLAEKFDLDWDLSGHYEPFFQALQQHLSITCRTELLVV